VIVAGLRYYSNDPSAGDDNYFVSRYARVRDYHQVMEEKLDRVQKIIKKELPEALCRAFCDAGPVTEKAWAIRAGLGWRGKHSLVINRDIGSFFFLGPTGVGKTYLAQKIAEFLFGDADALVSRAMQDELAAAIPDADLLVYPGAGHTPRWDEPIRFSDDLAAFARRVGHGRSSSSSG